MRNFVLPLLAAAAFTAFVAAATPALADETRVEARAGVEWLPGTSKGTAGVAAGHDFDLGPGAFTGLEVSADKALASGYKTAFGLQGRAGVKLLGYRVYGIGGYTTEPCDNCRGNLDLGAGGELAMIGPFYGKVEYKHLFADRTGGRDTVLAGIGVHF